MKNRILKNSIQEKLSRKTGRICVLTGARQTGKTTLVKSLSEDYAYISLDDPALRDTWKELTAEEWYRRYPRAILDEVQKVPSLIDSIKAVHDRHDDSRYILLGSSQILLLKQVRESLAGRVSLFELFPLTLPESRTEGWETPVQPSFLIKLLTGKISPDAIRTEKPLLDSDFADKQIAWENYLQYGLMPVMTDTEMDAEEKQEWLRNYSLTYLQRDLADIARVQDLESFRQIQKQSALLTAKTLNYSQLAAYSSLSVNTVKKFLSYLELSYQTFLLPPWTRNELKRTVKSPKLHYLDLGISRTLTGHFSALNGHEFESAVVGEIYKQIKTAQLPVDLYHLRTSDGREVDLLLETEQGYFAFEVKMTNHVRSTDFRHLRGLDEILDKPLLGGSILSQDRQIHQDSDNLTALPAAWFLG